MQQEDFKQLEQVLKSAKGVDSPNVTVDENFKESLRKKLYEHYLNSYNNSTVMSKIKSVFTRPAYATLFFLGAFAFIALAFAGGYFISKNVKQENQQKDQEILLAANLAVLEGDVEIKKTGEERWMEALEGDTFNQGDSLRTQANSRAVLILDNGDAVRMNEKSEIVLESMNPDSILVEQVSGESYARIASSNTDTFTIEGQGVEAQAMGTAYMFNTNSKKKEVNVYVYESKVQLKLQAEEQEVKELKMATVNTKRGKIRVREMKKNEYQNKFAKWSRNQDKKEGYETPETVGPKVTISSPANGSSTKNSSVAVKGKVTDTNPLRKIIVNGKIYESMGGNGKGFNPSTGEFNVNVSLSSGKNTISVTAYDIYWNAGKSATVRVNKKQQEKSDNNTSGFYISSLYSPAEGKISVSWVLNDASAPKGFKVVKSTSPNPVYPGNEYKYLSDSGSRSVLWTGVSSGTYYVRVCIYSGEGKCLRYTENKVVTVKGDGGGGKVSSISLSGSGSKVSWSVDGYSSKGFKVVWSKNSGPTYPCRSGDKYHYLSSSSARSDTLTAFAGSGTYYVRVCEYLGGKCGVYSNQITVSLSK